MHNIRHSICSVIPPHILEHAAAHGDAETRKRFSATLDRTEALRHVRHRAGARAAVGAAVPQRYRVYDSRHSYRLPGHLLVDETKGLVDDVEAREAFDGAVATRDFYSAVFGRTSIDGGSLVIDSTVHYGSHFDNALWNGSRMIYGDGDGKVFNRFTIAVEIIAHELTHGLTQYTTALGYSGQTGALNEHISDAFGILVKQYTLRQSAEASDWLIGAGLFTRAVKAAAVRSMKAPGTAYDDPLLGRDPQPAHMRDYVKTRADNGGVHVNSGIPNHAFYLAAAAVGGRAWEAVGRIWYATLTSGLRADTQFLDFANATVAVAGRMYGRSHSVQQAVADAWSAVGIPISRVASTPRLQGKWRSRPIERRVSHAPAL